MLNNLKLTTFTWILAILMAFTTAVIVVAASLVEKNIVVISDTWELYQTDLSEKARLEGKLRSAIGYGGLIHDFKNLVLRSDEKYREYAESHLGAAEAVLEQYSTLELTTAELVAIEDIRVVFTAYHEAIHTAHSMIVKGHTITDIEHAVVIDDEPAIRGLKVLRHEVVSKQKNNRDLSKSRVLADLRAALGYNGMIHKFKNHILSHEVNGDDELKDGILADEIMAKMQMATDSINQYRQLNLDEAERLALNDIEVTLERYSNTLTETHSLMEQYKSIKALDRAIKVDDTPALRGFHILETEINRQITTRATNVTKSLKRVNQAILFGKWGSVLSIAFIVVIAVVLIRFFVIHPILKLTQNMMRLADNKFDTEISGYQAQNEIGQMARAVVVFKTNMIKQQESERDLAKANEELQQQLKENTRLRERSEEQVSKALLMAEHMAEARFASDKAMIKAEKGELFVSSVLNAVRDAIITINASGIIETFNPGAEEIFGYKAYEVIEKNISMLMPEPSSSAHDAYLERFIDGKSTRDQSKPVEQTALRKNGETFPVEIKLNTIHIADEIKITGVVRDVSERKKWEEQIKQLAMTDPLTGLANRNHYDQSLQQAIQHAQRFKTRFALLLIDLDNFKPVNDNYGHLVGDILLQKVAEVLTASCREVDTVARLGGDEFAIILNGINDPEDVIIPAEKLIKELSHPFSIESNNIQISASVGISCYPNDGTDIITLMRMADEALYVSKQEGRHTYRYYSKIPK